MSEKKNILYVCIYTAMGGGEYGLLNLIRYLDRDKYHPIVLFNDEGPLVEHLRWLNVEILIVPFSTVMLKQLISPKIFWHNFKASFLLRSKLKDKKIDLIQSADVLSLLLLLPTILFRRIPIIYSVIFFYESSRAVLFNLLAFIKVKKIITLSKIVGDDLLRKTVGLKDKLHCIYWGVDTSLFYRRSPEEKTRLRHKLGLPDDKKLIGFIGRYDTWKGHLTFLEAARNLNQNHSDLCFLVVGGAMTEEIIPEVRQYHRQVSDAVSLFNSPDTLIVWDHREDVPEIMACLDVFVCPSDYEPLGLVVFEAVACGLPVVASRTVGAVEVLEGIDSLFLAEPKNPGSFTKVIEDALIKSNTVMPLEELKLPTWEAYSHRYIEIYEKILK
jgi:glycosyltransferase involved in cell wall biosynthesis